MKIRTKDKKQKPVDELNKRVQELETGWKRALADYQNLEKRIKQDKQRFVRLANAALIDKLLSVVDDLERASLHLKDDGIKLILNQLKGIFESEGVKEIEAEGHEFDPEAMDCKDMVAGKKNIVMRVLLKGYTLNNHVIRPAKVEVGTGITKKDIKVKTKKEK